MPRNREHWNAYMREFRKRPEAAVKQQTRYQKYYAKHKEAQIASAKAYYWANKEKIAARSKAYRERQPEALMAYRKRAKENRYHLKYHLKNTYGITVEERDALFAQNNGMCWICSKRASDHIDHCHDTGKVRGALCHQCNVGIGYLDDDIELLLKAIQYLRKDYKHYVAT